MKKWLKRAFVAFVVAFISLMLLGCAGLFTLDRWLFDALHPGPFVEQKVPPAPDYGKNEAWAALPEMEDGADVFLPKFPAIDQKKAGAAVFYVHPTTWVGPLWNGPYDGDEVKEATHRGGTLIQASAFNACCAVYGPRYRQANGNTYVAPSKDGDRAFEVAYSDVSKAFDVFLQKIGKETPFLIAAHSQGAMLAARLVKDRLQPGGALSKRFVVAYLVGGAVYQESIGDVKVCASRKQTGCVAAWNARAPEYEPNGFEFDAARKNPLSGRLCVNPLSWSTDGAHVGKDENRGAIFFDTPVPKLLPAFADAQCVDGALIIKEVGEMERDFMSRLLLWLLPGNYHPVEYQLFYVNLREDAVRRVQSFGDRL